MDDVREQFGDAGLLHSTMVYNRLITFVSGGTFCHPSICASMVPACAQTVQPNDADARHPVDERRKGPEGPGSADIHQQAEGNGQRVGARLSREHTDRVKIGVLIRMMPDELQDVILQHADRLQEVKLVKEKEGGEFD